MDINMTLVVQMLVFGAFVWFTMKFVWPPICKALDERQAKIAEGLAAADRGKHELELAHEHIKQEMKNAKVQAAELLDKANKQAAHMVEEARNEAKLTGAHMIKQAQEQIELEVQHAKKRLRTEVADLVMSGMEKVIQGTLPEATKKQAVDQLISDISKE